MLVVSRQCARDAGQFCGEALDVLEQEPSMPVTRSLAAENPHISCFSAPTETEHVRIQAQNAITPLETGAPISPVHRST